jgi:hypothetical protein
MWFYKTDDPNEYLELWISKNEAIKYFNISGDIYTYRLEYKRDGIEFYHKHMDSTYYFESLTEILNVNKKRMKVRVGKEKTTLIKVDGPVPDIFDNPMRNLEYYDKFLENSINY